jgi:hypothetical protein
MERECKGVCPNDAANDAGIWNQLEFSGYGGIKGVWPYIIESFGAVWIVGAIEQL